mgnify:CR=1 FL=1
MQPYPQLNTPFTLTLDFDSVDPLKMARDDGYSDLRDWKFNGPKITGKKTQDFMLVKIGDCNDLDEVREKLAKYGEIPDGRWREAFKAAFPKPDGNGSIGFADPSWVSPSGDVFFPVVYSFGVSGFGWAERERDVVWRWLVPVGKFSDTQPLGTSLSLESRIAELRKQDADLAPGFNVTAEYRLGELRGYNKALDDVLKLAEGRE